MAMLTTPSARLGVELYPCPGGVAALEPHAARISRSSRPSRGTAALTLTLCAAAAAASAAWTGPAAAQPLAAEPRASETAAPARALALVAKIAPAVFDPEALRAQLEIELALPVQRVDSPAGPHLIIEATSPAAVRVAFVRQDAPTVERTLDVSNTGSHAIETIALVSANLMRDEAAGLLDDLRAAQPLAGPPVALAPPVAPRPPPPPPAPIPPAMPTGCAPNRLTPVMLGVDFLPYVGMSSRQGTRVERKISLGVLGGITGGVRGFELAGLFNIDDHSVCGVQISGLANLVDGPLQGLQFGAIDWVNGRVDGAQFGLIEVTMGTLKGVQYGMVQFAAGDITGAQMGLVNVGGGSLVGAQLGLANVTATSVLGAQLGLANIGGSSVLGAQLGMVNVAGGDAQGTQLGLANIGGGGLEGFQAGLVNVNSGRVRGAMIGLVNVAEDADAAIGVLNVLWHGRTHLDVWGTDAGLFMVGVEHGSRYVHNITGFGFAVRDKRSVFAPAYGIGVRLIDRERVFVDLDALVYGLFTHDRGNDEIDAALINQLRVPIGFRLSPTIALFVSPALNVSVAHDDDVNLLADPALYESYRPSKSDSRTTVRLWPGFTVGARLF